MLNIVRFYSSKISQFREWSLQPSLGIRNPFWRGCLGKMLSLPENKRWLYCKCVFFLYSKALVLWRSNLCSQCESIWQLSDEWNAFKSLFLKIWLAFVLVPKTDTQSKHLVSKLENFHHCDIRNVYFYVGLIWRDLLTLL